MPGTIIFKPIEANLQTKDKDLIGKMDPYCLFHVGLHRVKSQVCKSGGTHPVWNEEIPVEFKNESLITVDVKDKDMLIDDKIGTFEVDLREIEAKGQVKKWYPLFLKNQPMGEILLEAYCPGGAFKQQGLTQTGLNQGVYNQGLSNQGLTHTGLNQGTYTTGLSNQGLHQGGYNQSLNPLNQGTHITGLSTQGLHQGGYPQQTLNQPLSHGSNLGGSYPLQGNLPTTGGYPLQGNLPTTGGLSNLSAPHNFAEEALMRGVDPTNLQQKLAYNTVQTQGLGNQQFGNVNTHLTQSSSLNQPAEMIYEGDRNRFNNPPHQMAFGHGHHAKQDPMNPLNQNQNLGGNNPSNF